MKTIDDYEVVEHGVDAPDYFQGCGVCGTPYTHVVTGTGETFNEALRDALDDIPMHTDEPVDSTALDIVEIGARLPDDRNDEFTAESVFAEHAPRPETLYFVRFRSFSGLSEDEPFDDLESVRKAFADRVRLRLRSGLERGPYYRSEDDADESSRSVEFVDPDDSVMQSDLAGTLSLEVRDPHADGRMDEWEERLEESGFKHFVSVRYTLTDQDHNYRATFYSTGKSGRRVEQSQTFISLSAALVWVQQVAVRDGLRDVELSTLGDTATGIPL